MNRGGGALSALNAQNIPSGANSHQHHILAVTQNLRRFYGRKLVNMRTNYSVELQNSRDQNAQLEYQLQTSRNQNVQLDTQNVQLDNQLAAEQFYQGELVIHDIIEQIEVKEQEEKKKKKRKTIVKFIKVFLPCFILSVSLIVRYLFLND